MSNNKSDRQTINEQKEFMANFDPDRSNREQRKLNQLLNSTVRNNGSKQNLYDEKGVHVASGKDLCDCLTEECPGCFFPCPKCGSCKCGHECREGRKWMYDCTEVEGIGTKKTNKYK